MSSLRLHRANFIRNTESCRILAFKIYRGSGNCHSYHGISNSGDEKQDRCRISKISGTSSDLIVNLGEKEEILKPKELRLNCGENLPQVLKYKLLDRCPPREG